MHASVSGHRVGPALECAAARVRGGDRVPAALGVGRGVPRFPQRPPQRGAFFGASGRVGGRRTSVTLVRGAPPKVDSAPNPLIVPFEDEIGEVAPLSTVSVAPSQEPTRDVDPERWQVKYLYDGGCTVCKSLVAMLKSRGEKFSGRIWFEDISVPTYTPKENQGITFLQAMETIHVIQRKDGEILTGMAALTKLYETVGLGWAFKLASLPGFKQLAEIAYKFISKNRISMSEGINSGLLAVGRISMEEKGEGSCSDPEGECRDKPLPVVEEAVTEQAKEAGFDAAALLTPGSDRDHVLGIYIYGRGAGARAAPVDIKSGKFLASGAQIPMRSSEPEDVAETVTELVKHFKWQGNIGIGIPGQIDRTTSGSAEQDERRSENDGAQQAEEEECGEDGCAVDFEPFGGDGREESIAAAMRKEAMKSPKRRMYGEVKLDRLKLESFLRDEVGRDVSLLTGSESNGFGEMTYGAGRGERGLVCMCTLGKGIGVALFEDGVLVRNLDVTESTFTWALKMWEDSQLPSKSVKKGEPEWQRWAERVEAHLVALDGRLSPDVFIIGGAASLSFSSWGPIIEQRGLLKTPLKCAQLFDLAGVKGAAAGAGFNLRLKDDMARLRSALGQQFGISPHRINRDQILEVFNNIDADGDGEVSFEELERSIRAMGIKLPKEEVRELFLEIDEAGSGFIDKEEFTRWWKSMIAAKGGIELLHTEAEWDQVVEEETKGEGLQSRLVVLQVGFTYCKPCKGFAGAYRAYAQQFSDARFIKINGNENKDMIHLARDRLKVKSTPTFYFFRNGELVSSHSTANRDLFAEAISGAVLPGETGFGEDPIGDDPAKFLAAEKAKKAKQEATKDYMMT